MKEQGLEYLKNYENFKQVNSIGFLDLFLKVYL